MVAVMHSTENAGAWSPPEAASGAAGRGPLSVVPATVLHMSRPAFRPSILVRVVMLAAAYAPLAVLLSVLDSFRSGWLRWALLGLAAAGLAGTVVFLALAVPRRNATVERVFSAKPREGEALKFFASYVVPFFVTASAPATARWGLLIYLTMIALLYVQGDLYFSNPLLAALGYRIFELGRADQGFLLVISRSWHIAPGDVLSLVPLGGYIYVERQSARGRPPPAPVAPPPTSRAASPPAPPPLAATATAVPPPQLTPPTTPPSQRQEHPT